MSESMVERVARAIWDQLIEQGSPSRGRTLMIFEHSPERPWCAATARAAIEAMRELPPQLLLMLHVQPDVGDGGFIIRHSIDKLRPAWNAMIDAALSQQEERGT